MSSFSLATVLRCVRVNKQEAEKAGEAGNVDESVKLMEEVEALKMKMAAAQARLVLNSGGAFPRSLFHACGVSLPFGHLWFEVCGLRSLSCVQKRSCAVSPNWPMVEVYVPPALPAPRCACVCSLHSP